VSRHWGGALALCSLLSAAALVLPARGQFETRASSPLTSVSYSIGVADFNRDGIVDAAVASFETDQVAVFLGNGDGTFRRPTYYSVGRGPESLAIADFNHDGNLDLATNGEGANPVISILFGNGDGTFQPATDVIINAAPTYVGVGDFNGDHIPDLIAVDSPYISVLLGNGDGTFQPPIDTVFAPTPIIGVGDFNRDGKLDVAAAVQSGAASTVTILLGNGDGTFQLGGSYDINDAPNSMVVAEFRGTGVLDLAIGSYLGSDISVLLGNGDGTFQPKVDYATPGTCSFLASGDLNGDGKLDLVSAGSTAGDATVFLGKGDGTFRPGVSYFVTTESGVIAIGDLNGDKKPDLVVTGGAASGTPTDLFALLNTGVVSFSPTTPLNFKKQAVGTTSPPQTVTLTNTGRAALRIASMKASTEFAVTSTCGATVAAGAKCTISVTFSPTQKGAKQGTISIVDSASTKPQVIELLGTGT